MKNIETRKIFKSGDIIMQQNEHGDCAYIIEKGRVEIIVEKANGLTQRVATRGEGTIIGEMAIVDDEPRTATVRAIEDCSLLSIRKADFNRRLENADPILQLFTQVILTRYRDMLSNTTILKSSSDLPDSEDIERGYIEKGKAVEAILMANELRAAIGTEQLSLHYQPIVHLDTGKIAGFEALMRWKHPEKGSISPALFIPVAEESGLIIDLSRWALEEACYALARIEQTLLPEDRTLFMSVNFSTADFTEPDFIEALDNILKKTGTNPHKIHIEITERLLVNNPEIARECLRTCREKGMEISIDDFGTGYSSLSYLHFFPISTLKIDQSFVRNLNKDKTSFELVKTIIALGMNMNLEIIAEGIETIEESNKLSGLGCSLGQGYHYCKPVPEKDLFSLVATPFGLR